MSEAALYMANKVNHLDSIRVLQCDTVHFLGLLLFSPFKQFYSAFCPIRRKHTKRIPFFFVDCVYGLWCLPFSYSFFLWTVNTSVCVCYGKV